MNGIKNENMEGVYLEELEELLIKYPLVYKSEYSFKSLLENDDPDFWDYVPDSAFQKDLVFQGLTTFQLDSYFGPGSGRGSLLWKSNGTEDNEEDKSEQSPCQAALAIEANLPVPSPRTMSYWRSFVSAALYHPNILAHSDVESLRELFDLFGCVLSFKNDHFIIEAEQIGNSYKPVFNILPSLSASCPAPAVTFAHIRDFKIEPKLKLCLIQDYSIMDFMKEALTELVNFIIEYPEALYLETYGFVLDFLLLFGISSDIIIDSVMRTQRRRRKAQHPASVLILKQANKLDKAGRKQFLQQKMQEVIDSPVKKFDPVVPIITEPSPVRHLRNRTTGFDHSPVKDVPQILLQNSTRTENTSATENTSTINTASFMKTTVIKGILKFGKKLGKSRRKLAFQNVNTNSAIRQNCVFERYKSPDGRILSRKKKRFYQRRDDSLLEKTFTCSLCKDRNFTYKGNLVVHMKKHHPNVKLPSPLPPKKLTAPQAPSPTTTSKPSPSLVAISCPVCLKDFTYKSSYVRHMGAQHPDFDLIKHAVKPLSTPSVSSKNMSLSSGSPLHARRSLRKLQDSHDEVSEQSSAAAVVESSLFDKSGINGVTTISSYDGSTDMSNLAPTSASSLDNFSFRVESGINFRLDKVRFPSIGNVNNTTPQQQYPTVVK